MGGLFDWLTSPSKTPVSSTQSTTTTLGSQAQGLFDSSGNLFANLSKPITPFQGPTVAGFDPLQVQGQNAVAGAATGPIQGLTDAGTAAQKHMLDLNNLDVTNNPLITNQANAISTNAVQDFLQRTAPAFRQNDTQAGGAYSGGNTHAAIAMGQGQADASRALQQTLAKLYGDAYTGEANRMQTAQGQNAGVINNATAPGTVLDAVGQAKQQQQQKEIDAQVALDTLTKTMPLQQAMLVLQAIGMMPGATTTSTGTGTVPGPSPLQSALGMGTSALGAAGLLGWKPFASAGASGVGTAAAGGEAAGGAASLLPLLAL